MLGQKIKHITVAEKYIQIQYWQEKSVWKYWCEEGILHKVFYAVVFQVFSIN